MYHKISGVNVLLLSSILLFSIFFPLSFAQLDDNLNSSQPSVLIISISDIILEDSTTGLTSVTGNVLNNSTENVMNIKVDVILYDADNITIRETSRFVTSPFTVYEPGSVERFSFLMSIEDFDHYTARAYAERVL
ncbi:MAG: FxLYD domain-containing protein [Candidatus Nitrosocosmicus sp.]|nr:FxLYD domain-containing protein [Candidatus Nitrosocosmicus sp.]MDN5868660.1 FxLYD domain-containing protein [Candidatus Nitrosocosmicus sp.]